MGPGETLVALTTIVSLFVIMPAIIAGSVRRGRRERAASGGEMRMSELRETIAQAVQAATAPLAARITDLEERLGDEPVDALRARVGAPSARLDAPALTAAFDPEADLDDADGRPLQRRARA